MADMENTSIFGRAPTPEGFIESPTEKSAPADSYAPRSPSPVQPESDDPRWQTSWVNRDPSYGRTSPIQRGARSLFDTAMEVVKANVNRITETNDTPLTILLPLTKQVNDPHQLGAWEKSSPQLVGEISDVWFQFIKTSFPEWQRMLQFLKHSSGPHKGSPFTEAELAKCATYAYFLWFEKREKREEQRAIDSFRAAQAQNASENRSKKTGLIKGLAPPISRKRGPADKFRGVSNTLSDGSMRFAGGSRTSTKTSAGVMKKVYRETAETSLSRPGGVLGTPSHLLRERAKIGKRAPPATSKPASSITTYRNSINMVGRSVDIPESNIARPSSGPRPSATAAKTAAKRTGSEAGHTSTSPAKRPSDGQAIVPQQKARPKLKKTPNPMLRKIKHMH